MKSPSLARTGRLAPLAAVLLALAARCASADGVPVPDPVLPFIEHVTVGVAACDTCAPIACPGEPVRVTVSGHLQAMCYQFRGIHEAAPLDTIPVRVAEFVVDTCRAACPDLIEPFSGTTFLPPQAPGQYLFILRVAVRTCPDSSVVVDSSRVAVGYQVQPQCEVTPPPPPSPDSLVRSFVKLATVPAHPCAGDRVTLQLIKNPCPPCVHLTSFGFGAGADPAVLQGALTWAPACLELACHAETLSTRLGRFAQGSYHVVVAMTAHVLGTENPDSAIAFPLPLAFEVGAQCSAPPGSCVVREMQSDVPVLQCALTIAPGDTGSVPLLYASELPMAGVQGIINVPPPFKLTDLRVASGLSGVHLSMLRNIAGVRWVVFTDPGVTLAAGTAQHLLDATVAVDASAPHGLSELMTAAITLASDSAGNALPLCDRKTLVAVAIRLCTAAVGNSACDVNHDGQLDVRDLVRMVGCLKHGTVDTTGACVDCDSSGVFDIADIFCCARDILRGPGVPRDSVHADAAVSVAFDPIEDAGGGDLLVRVRVRGAHTLSAGLLRLDYPADLWSVADVARPASGSQPVDVDWYPMIDHLDSGHIYVGAVRIGDSGSDEFSFQVTMVPGPSLVFPPASADQIKVVSADLAALDGSVITPKDPLPSVALQASVSPGITAVELAPARPNPFNGSTTFLIRLPVTAPVDLAVHDLAGRRVATIAHAVYGPGEHAFSWDGGGARDGLYFVRLSVNGQVFSTRVAMLRDGR